MTTPPVLAWVDGALTPRDDARISIDDFAVRYGAACFETMLARHGQIFRLEAHLDRLDNGLRAMHVTPPPRDVLAGAVEETLRGNGLEDAAVRLTVTAGHGHAPDLGSARDPAVLVTADLLPPSATSPRLSVASIRIDERRPLATAKHTHFLPYLLARAEARAQGYDDAVLLNLAGTLAEAATANLFLLVGDALLTPAIIDGALPGVTRATLIEVAGGLGIAVAEQPVPLSAVVAAQALLLTSSVAGVVPAASLHASPLVAPSTIVWQAATPPPALVAALVEGYAALVERECAG